MAASEYMRNHRGQKAMRSQIQGAKKKKPECQPKILYPANLSFKNEGENLRHSQKNKNWENLLLEDLPYMKY